MSAIGSRAPSADRKAPPSSAELQAFGQGVAAFAFRDELKELFVALKGRVTEPEGRCTWY